MPLVSLQSINFQDRFIRHQNFLGEISPIQSDLDKQDATFNMEEFVNNAVRLHSINFPTHVFRHQDFRLKLHEFNIGLIPPPELGGMSQRVQLLLADSTFVRVPGLADPTLISFRSRNFPDRFIRHRDFHLFVEPADSDLARRDATFRLSAPFFVPPPAPPGPVIR